METKELLETLAAIVVAFFVLREIFCWYWKLNKVVTLLEEILTKLGGKNEQA